MTDAAQETAKNPGLGPLGKRLLAGVTLLVVVVAGSAICLEHSKSRAFKDRGVWVKAEVDHYWKNQTKNTRGISYTFVTAGNESVKGKKRRISKAIYRQAKRDKTIPIVYDPQRPQYQSFTLDAKHSLMDLVLNLLMLSPLVVLAGWLLKTAAKKHA